LRVMPRLARSVRYLSPTAIRKGSLRSPASSLSGPASSATTPPEGTIVLDMNCLRPYEIFQA
jgi:hypothetical protein